MCFTNKEMDEAMERVQAMTMHALAHGSDNSADYVAGRYGALHGQHCFPVRVRRNSTVSANDRLFPASMRSQKQGAYDCRPAWPKPGCIVTLRNDSTGELGEYCVETNGRNGVEVVGSA